MEERRRAFIEIIRPSVCVLAVLGFTAGTIVAEVYGTVHIDKLILGLITTFLICASGNVINDYFDVEMDRINRPTRPVPSGRIKLDEALHFYVFLTALGNLLACFAGIYFFMLAAFNSFITFLYAWKLKRTPLVGNMTDSYLAAVVFVAPLFLIKNFNLHLLLASPAFVLSIIAFFGNMGREILKDVEDVEGDKKAGARTLPIIAGTMNATVIAYIFVTIGIIMAWLPALNGMLNSAYFPFLIISSVLVAASFAKHKNIPISQRILKVVMYLIIVGFIAGSI